MLGLKLNHVGKSFQQRCEAYRLQIGGGSVHVWESFHTGAKSLLVLPDKCLTGELYRDILRNTLMPFARQHFGDNYRYQDDNATPHCVQVFLDFFQRDNVTKMEQSARSPDWNPINHIWEDELGRAITSMVQSPVWTTRPRILVCSAKPCSVNGQKSL